jgi:hypothetical protein
MTHRHAEQAKTQQLLTKLANYTNMTKAMRQCLEAIANGDANAQQLATDTLAKLNKEHSNEFGRT